MQMKEEKDIGDENKLDTVGAMEIKQVEWVKC